MATINIGNLTFTHKGDYDGSTAYAKNDVVYYSTNGNAYIAKQATTGNAPTNATYWNQFAQGSGGIWNAGLSLGSAGQIVKVNSGASALEFGTIESGTHVKLAGGTISSSVSQLSLDHFSNTYTHYKIVGSNFSGTGEQQIRARFRSGGSNNTNGNYKWVSSHPIITSSGASYNSHGGWNNGHFSINGTNYIGTDNSYGCAFELDIFQPYQSKKTFFNTFSQGYESGGQLNGHIGGGFFEADTSFDGIAIYIDSNNLDAGDYAMYGVKY